jgi:hypothetical protein
MSGKLTLSPLAMAEAKMATGIPQLSREDLCNPAAVIAVVGNILRRTEARHVRVPALLESSTAA